MMILAWLIIRRTSNRVQLLEMMSRYNISFLINVFCIQIIYSSLDTYIFLFNQGKFNSFMSYHQILKRKRWKYIVESDTDEDDEMVDLKNKEIKAESSTKSIKEEKLEAFLATEG
jgi:hypothetical protein